MHNLQTAPAPLFRDPIYDGAADPSVIYNQHEKGWYIFYTNRRANVDCEGTSWIYGTDIGCASSFDNGKSWAYNGALDLKFEKGVNTFWAPHVLYDKGKYHLFVSYIRGVYNTWNGNSQIAHYESKNMWDWKLIKLLKLSKNSIIDPCVFKKASGKWGLWFKENNATYGAEGNDLYHFTPSIKPVINDCGHEAPFVLNFKGYYWMLTDQWDGFGVYRSPDAEKWTKTGVILGKPGKRNGDEVRASHPAAVVVNDKAYVFYFTHPGWKKEGGWGDDSPKKNAAGILPHIYKYSVLQVAELKFESESLTCDRDSPFDFYLPNL